MNSPLISAIVPVYNVEQYLKKCFDSISSQSYDNIEIILVDDGSTDGCSDLCDRLAKKDKRVKVIHQKNAGLSAARNAGIKHSHGDFLAFIDSDDYVDQNFIAKLYESIDKKSPSISVCGFQKIKNHQIKQVVSINPSILPAKIALDNLLVKQRDIDIITWNKLYHRDVFTKNNTTFPVGQVHEDNLTTYKLYASAKTVSYVGEPLYFYVQHPGSITDKALSTDKAAYKEQAAEEAVQWLKKHNPKSVAAAQISLLYAKLTYLDTMIQNRQIDKQLWHKQTSWIKEHYADFKKNPHLSFKLKTYLFLLRFGVLPYKILKTVLFMV